MEKMTHTTGKPRISAAKKQILEAAAELFREKGYAATSVREIAQKVGLEASSLYSHIKSKEQILIEICMDNAYRFTEGLENIVETCGSNIEQLRQIIRLHITIAAEGISSVMVFNDEWKHLNEPQRSEFLKLRKNYEQRVQSIIEQGITAGEIKEVDPRVALYSFLTALRWVHYRIKPGKMSKDKLYEHLCTILLEGMAR